MKKLFTKMLALTAFFVLFAGSINAQTGYLDVTEETTIIFSKTFVNEPSNDYISWSKGTSNWSAKKGCLITANTDVPNMSSTDRFLTLNVKGVEKFDLAVTNSTAGRTYTVQIGTAAARTITHGGNNCETESFDTNNTGETTIIIKGGGQSVYPLHVILYPATSPSIFSFEINDVPATIDNVNNTITAELPFGTNLTAITPDIVLNGTANSYTPTGEQDFTNQVLYSIYESEDGTGEPLKTYTVTLTVAQTQSSDATLSDLKVNGNTVVGFQPDINEYNINFAYMSQLPVVTAEENDVAATIDEIQQLTAFPGSVTVNVTAQDGSANSYTINFTIDNAPKVLSEVIFSNSFNAFIIQGEEEGTVTAYYLAGKEVPTITSCKVETTYPTTYEISGDGSKITVTGDDGTTKDFTINVEAVTPYAPSSTELVSFDGTESWIKTGSAFRSDQNRGWVISKNGEEVANRRNSEGKNRIYFFIGACDKLTFTVPAGITSTRAIKVYADGTEKASLTAPKGEAIFDVQIDKNEPTMIAITSNQDNGDAGFSKVNIVVPTGTVSIENVTNNVLSFNGRTILNPEKQEIRVFDATGRVVVQSTENIDMSLQPKGVYIVKSINETLKISLIK